MLLNIIIDLLLY